MKPKYKSARKKKKEKSKGGWDWEIENCISGVLQT